MASFPGPCPHIPGRLDGALLAPCDECSTVEHKHELTIIFHGGGEMNSREAFHERTIGDAIRAQGFDKNPDAEPVGTRWT